MCTLVLFDKDMCRSWKKRILVACLTYIQPGWKFFSHCKIYWKVMVQVVSDYISWHCYVPLSLFMTTDF
jgi:hypothetical protein